MPTLQLELAAGAPAVPVAGIDEVGRGPLAGPVMAAAVILPAAGLPAALVGAIDDSKVLTAERRLALFPEISGCCAVGVGRAEVDEIEALNIHHASLLAMARAVAALPAVPAFALVDGRHLPPGLCCPGRAVVDGDALSLSIAAASIIAKVTRDRLMAELAAEFPGYGWERNVGYATREHCAAIRRLGVTPHHRRRFATVAEQLSLKL